MRAEASLPTLLPTRSLRPRAVTSTFGELRSLLQQAPSARLWASICLAVEQMDGEELREVALPYLRAHLARWDDGMRTMPARWVTALLEGKLAPHMEIARTLTLSGYRFGRETFHALGPVIERAGVTRLNLFGTQLSAESVRALVSRPFAARLHTLNMRQNALNDEAIEALASAELLTGLVHLDLSQNQLGDDALDALGRAPHLDNLRDLRLDGCRVSELGVRALLQGPRRQTLETLTLKSTTTLPRTAHTLATLSLPALRRLDLSQTPVPDETLRALLDAPWAPQLDTLRLAAAGITNDAATLLAGHAAARGLRTLHLNNNAITGDGARALIQSPNLVGLEELSLSHNDLSDAPALFAGCTLRALRRLNLSHTALPVDALGRIGAGEHLPVLRALDLSHVPLDLRGARALASAVHWRHIEEVNLAATRLNMWAVTSLMRAPWMCTVRRLDLSGVDLGGALGEVASGRALQRVEELKLSRCKLDGDPVAHLASALQHPRLLDLSHNQIGRAGIRALLDAPWIRTLEQLDLSHCDLDDASATLLGTTPKLANLQKLTLRSNYWNRAITHSGLTLIQSNPHMRLVQLVC